MLNQTSKKACLPNSNGPKFSIAPSVPLVSGKRMAVFLRVGEIFIFIEMTGMLYWPGLLSQKQKCIFKRCVSMKKFKTYIHNGSTPVKGDFLSTQNYYNLE